MGIPYRPSGHLSVPSSRVKELRQGQEVQENIFLTSCALKVGPKAYPETSVRNYHSALRNISEGRISQFCFK